MGIVKRITWQIVNIRVFFLLNYACFGVLFSWKKPSLIF